MFRKAMSEHSSARKEVGYDKVFQSGHEPKEGFSWLSERESFAHSLDDEVESYNGGEVEEEEREECKDEGDEGGEDKEDDGDDSEVDGKASEGGSLGSPRDGHTRPFILSKMWTINDFKPTIMANIFKNLRDRYQIPDHIPICLPGKFEKCYSGKAVNVGMYDAMFTARLRLPLMALHRQLVDFLGLSVNQVTPNA